MSEHTEQVKVIQFCKAQRVPVFAIPNGMWVPGLTGGRLFGYINKMKAEGMSPGVPDLFIPLAKQGNFGMFIEMKKIKGDNPSAEQEQWLKLLSKNGYKAICCKGSAIAIKEIQNYIKGV